MKRRKVPNQKLVLAGKTTRLNPFENFVDLRRVVSIRMRGRRIGAFLLQKGNAYKVVFGFRCAGIHSTLRDEAIDTVFDALESGLKDLPNQETVTFHLSSFSSDESRQVELRQVVDHCPSEELQYLIMAEQAKVRELTSAGIRKPKEMYIYVTYTPDPGFKGADWIEKAVAMAEIQWQKFTGEYSSNQRGNLVDLLTNSVIEGCLPWERLLNNKFNLDARLMSDQDLWSVLWRRVNPTNPREVPQLLVVEGKEIYDESRGDVDGTTLLLEHIPSADRSWVKVRDNYVGLCTFWEKPAGWASKKSQMRYLWDVVAREAVAETEIFCQLMPANPKLIQSTSQLLLKQSNTAADRSAKSNSRDVVSEKKADKAAQIQSDIYEGARPIYTSVVVCVHRPSLVQLDEACRTLESYFQRPAWVAREDEYAWKVWLQTLPITWERMMATPFDRRQVYTSGEVPGLMPVVTTAIGDSSGFELISEEGGSPVFLDLFKSHKNLGLFATTRAGKSVLVSGILTQALARGMPVIALDFPKPDGTSTFTDYTQFVGGAYFDISRESNNLFEMPDLRNCAQEEERKERLIDYKSFLESALLTMVIGDAEGKAAAQMVRSLLVLALDAFFYDPEIQSRYEAALEGGFGSLYWGMMPTLADFLGFCSRDRLDLTSVQGGDINEGLERIQIRLRFWLTSRVGQAISAPSSFPTDAQLLVFALRNLSNEEDAAVLALSAYSAALRRALSSPASIFFIDEAPILFEFSTISSLVGRLCANGAKAGVRVILSGQDPDTIARSVAATKIFQNLTTRLIGRIQPTAVDSFVSILKYPREIVGRNATESFFPKREGLYSQWLLDDCGKFTYVRYYPSKEQLAAVANNPDEQAARTRTLSTYPDKFEGMAEFSRQYVSAIVQGKSL